MARVCEFAVYSGSSGSGLPGDHIVALRLVLSLHSWRLYLVFVLIKPIVLELIELFVIAVNFLLKSVKTFFKYTHLQGEVIEDLCGHGRFGI